MFTLLSKAANLFSDLDILIIKLTSANIIRFMNSNINLSSTTAIFYLAEAYHPYKQGDLNYKNITILR